MRLSISGVTKGLEPLSFFEVEPAVQVAATCEGPQPCVFIGFGSEAKMVSEWRLPDGPDVGRDVGKDDYLFLSLKDATWWRVPEAEGVEIGRINRAEGLQRSLMLNMNVYFLHRLTKAARVPTRLEARRDIAGFILSGAALVRDPRSDKSTELPAGSFFRLPKEIAHAVECVENECVLLTTEESEPAELPSERENVS